MSDAKICPHTLSCQMYELFQLQGALNVWKMNYCRGDYGRCARYKMSEVGGSPPVNLMPNGKLLNRPGG